jgi:hypothetical protein
MAQIDKVADARADLEKANAKMLLGIRGVLTPDQWTKLRTRGPALPGARPKLATGGPGRPPLHRQVPAAAPAACAPEAQPPAPATSSPSVRAPNHHSHFEVPRVPASAGYPFF